jgi:hypothetical protein
MNEIIQTIYKLLNQHQRVVIYLRLCHIYAFMTLNYPLLLVSSNSFLQFIYIKNKLLTIYQEYSTFSLIND